MKYEKPPLSADDHINLLSNRGLSIPDIDKAKRYLANIGYYRLTGYMYHLQERDGSHMFKTNVEFDNIISHYHFDKELRLLISDYLERVEVALRARLIDKFCMAHGFFWYTNEDLYGDQTVYDAVNEEIEDRYAK